MISVSKRLTDLPVSSVRKLSPYAAEAKNKGVKIYHLNIGDPDIKTPKVMIDVLRNWSINPIRYANSSGESEFIQALRSYYNGLGFTQIKESDILATVGGSEAVVMAMYATCGPGDEILVFEPFYSNYATCAKFCDIKLVPVETTIKNGFHLPDRKVIEEKITRKAKAILVCSPNNPTGAIYTRKEYKILVEIAKEKNLFLISDEVYREYIFGNIKHTSVLEFLNEIPEQIILLDSLSKRYSLCGARLGILMSLNQEVIKGTLKLAQGRLSGGIIDQMVGAKLTRVPKSYIEKVRQEYEKRRDVLYEGLSKIKGVFLTKPEGAFYTMVSLPVENAEDFSIYLLKDFRDKNETVMLAPGEGFYGTKNQGLNQVRIAYVLNTRDLKRCIEIIDKALQKYNIEKFP